jgi:hypothetical protein
MDENVPLRNSPCISPWPALPFLASRIFAPPGSLLHRFMKTVGKGRLGDPSIQFSRKMAIIECQ